MGTTDVERFHLAQQKWAPSHRTTLDCELEGWELCIVSYFCIPGTLTQCLPHWRQ